MYSASKDAVPVEAVLLSRSVPAAFSAGGPHRGQLRAPLHSRPSSAGVLRLPSSEYRRDIVHASFSPTSTAQHPVFPRCCPAIAQNARAMASYDPVLPRQIPTSYDPLTDPSSPVHLQCLLLPLYLALRLFAWVYALFDALLDSAHDRLCALLALPPCAVYRPRESAVLIVGGDDGQYFRGEGLTRLNRASAG